MLTINEIREMLGREPLKEGGDSVYISATLVPVGSDDFSSNTNEEDAKKLLDIVGTDGKQLLSNDLMEKAKLAYGESITTSTGDSQ